MNYLYVIMAMFLINGMARSGVTLVGFCLMCDFCPERTHTLVGAAWNVSEGLIYIYLTIYYRYINEYWLYPLILGLFQTLIAGLLILKFVPESPKWLYKKKRYKECYLVL